MKKLMLCIAFMLVGCEVTPEERVSYRDQQAMNLAESLSYYKDFRTDLCFAALWVGSNATSITNVPCSSVGDKVTIFRSREK